MNFLINMLSIFSKRLTHHFRAPPSRSRGSMMKSEASEIPEEHHQCLGQRNADYYFDVTESAILYEELKPCLHHSKELS